MCKSIIATGAFGLAALAAASAYAASTSVDANVSISQTALEFTNSSPIRFGSFDITSANASGTIQVANQSETTVDATGIVYFGGSAAGSFRLTGTPGAAIEYNCSSTATLAHESDPSQLLEVSSVQLGPDLCSVGIPSGAIGSDGTHIRNMGALLTFNDPITGTYSTANPGGAPITLDVVYQ